MSGTHATTSAQCYKNFTAVITPLAAYFSMILTELCCNYGHKRFYNIGHWWQKLAADFPSQDKTTA
jgi:hypothetical protein